VSDAEVDQWATLDELLGLEAIAEQSPAGDGIGRLAFYGRCSTEDNQDPRTSLAWQMGEATRFVEPLGGEIVAEYFDIGESRSLPWERREQASEVLSALKDPALGWWPGGGGGDAVLVRQSIQPDVAEVPPVWRLLMDPELGWPVRS
jgi:hypothetical protein